jgi:molecular chaperone GrpE
MNGKKVEPHFSEEPAAGTTPSPSDAPASAPAPSAEAATDHTNTLLQDFETQLAAAKAQVAEANERFLRAKAETENIRRRAELDVAAAHKYGIERFASELLGVRDSLDFARAVDLGGGPEVMAKVVEGLDLTLKLMETAFQKFGLTVIDPQGQKFDPEKQQAMTMVETDEVPPNHVLKVVQKGYQLHERLLRPAMVVVAKAKTPPSG